MRRRALVLTSEAARHRFRASLPPHVLSAKGRGGSYPLRRRRPLLTRQDLRDFLFSYCACLCAVGAFLI